MAVAIDQNREEYDYDSWLEMRQKGSKRGCMGASQLASALNLNPYEPAFVMWQKMTGRLPLDEETIPMRVGKHDEPLVAELYEERSGVKLIDPGKFTVWRHPEHDWLFATPDYLRQSIRRINSQIFDPVECKRGDSIQSHRWEDGGVPIEHEVQLFGQCACMGASGGVIVGLIGYELYPVEREFKQSVWDWMMEGLEKYRWHVLNDVPPQVDGSEATAYALRRLHPLDNGHTVQLPTEIAEKIRAWQEMTAEAKALEDLIKSAKNEIVAAIGDNTFGEVDGLKVSYKAQTRRAYEVSETTYRVLRKVGK